MLPNSQKYLLDFKTEFHGEIISNDADEIVVKEMEADHFDDVKSYLYPSTNETSKGTIITKSECVYSICFSKCKHCN